MSKDTVAKLLLLSWAMVFVMYGLEVNTSRNLAKRAEALQKIVNSSRALECVSPTQRK